MGLDEVRCCLGGKGGRGFTYGSEGGLGVIMGACSQILFAGLEDASWRTLPLSFTMRRLASGSRAPCIKSSAARLCRLMHLHQQLGEGAELPSLNALLTDTDAQLVSRLQRLGHADAAALVAGLPAVAEAHVAGVQARLAGQQAQGQAAGPEVAVEGA